MGCIDGPCGSELFILAIAVANLIGHFLSVCAYYFLIERVEPIRLGVGTSRSRQSCIRLKLRFGDIQLPGAEYRVGSKGGTGQKRRCEQEERYSLFHVASRGSCYLLLCRRNTAGNSRPATMVAK